MELSLTERALIATRLRAAIEICFAHWDDIPGFDLDGAVRSYLAESLEAEGRFAFDMATLRFMASLRNGHTGFDDDWLWRVRGRSFGILARPLAGDWTVTASRVPDLRPGDVIDRIDRQPIAEFFEEKRLLLPAPSHRAAAAVLFSRRYLFPERFALALADGRTVLLSRGAPSPEPPAAPSLSWVAEDRVALLRLPSFAERRLEDTALALVDSLPPGAALIVDLRGNDGGNTPGRLVRRLMDRPYRFWRETTPCIVALDRARGVATAPLVSPAEFEVPDIAAFGGRVILLIDALCASAAEDFIMPFKDNGRALLVGETTWGSSGQPYHEDLGDGMSFRVGAKREFFPDGSPFEGHGIAPDLPVELKATDLQAGRDPVLERALASL